MFRIEPHIYLSTYSRKILNQFINENIEIGQIFIHSENEHVLLSKLKSVALSILEKNPKALKYYYNNKDIVTILSVSVPKSQTPYLPIILTR